MKTYTHPQETWNEKECAKRARHAPANAYGDKPPKGIIARVIEGQWYEAEAVPLPVIPPSYEFKTLTGWGLTIKKAI